MWALVDRFHPLEFSLGHGVCRTRVDLVRSDIVLSEGFSFVVANPMRNLAHMCDVGMFWVAAGSGQLATAVQVDMCGALVASV